MIYGIEISRKNSIASSIAQNKHLYIGNSGGREEKETKSSVNSWAEVNHSV
jgi:hypothetical protein